MNTWIVYSYADPWYYDYNYNVVFEDEAVYINEDPVASADDYIAMGEEIVGDPIPDDSEEIEWMPLGVFAISTSESDSEPQMTLQLVMSKDGQLSGTYYHWQTQNMFVVHGSVDEETQRVAFKIGDQVDNVIEVGLSGLTEAEAPMWVHFGNEKTQTWTLVRLEAPESMKKDIEKLEAEEAEKEGEKKPEEEEKK